MAEKRLAIMNVPSEYLFFHFFAIPVDGKMEWRVPTLVHPGSGKLIKWQDCKIVSLNVDNERDCVQFKLQSDEFDIVHEGEVIPFVDFAIKERLVKVEPWDDYLHTPPLRSAIRIEYPPIGLNENFVDTPTVVDHGGES